jgi:hypothetical protein
VKLLKTGLNMLKDKIAPLVINGIELCPIKNDCPQKGITCKVCLTNMVLLECQIEIKEFFKDYHNDDLRKDLLEKLLARFALLDVKVDMQKLRG